jgi:hypothetical protein
MRTHQQTEMPTMDTTTEDTKRPRPTDNGKAGMPVARSIAFIVSRTKILTGGMKQSLSRMQRRLTIFHILHLFCEIKNTDNEYSAALPRTRLLKSAGIRHKADRTVKSITPGTTNLAWVGSSYHFLTWGMGCPHQWRRNSC